MYEEWSDISGDIGDPKNHIFGIIMFFIIALFFEWLFMFK